MESPLGILDLLSLSAFFLDPDEGQNFSFLFLRLEAWRAVYFGTSATLGSTTSGFLTSELLLTTPGLEIRYRFALSPFLDISALLSGFVFFNLANFLYLIAEFYTIWIFFACIFLK